MKTFLNVLYRRILYKIPLKLLLVLLAIFGVLFACFSNADFIQHMSNYQSTVNANSSKNITSYDDSLFDYVCFSCTSAINSNCISILNNNNTYSFSFQGSSLVHTCFTGFVGTDFTLFNSCSNNISVKYYYVEDSIPRNNYSSLQCQTEYNLIPISSVDQNYCTTNNLCPSQECPSVPSGSGLLTQLYINNILHVGAPTILMNIPDEIDWDYAYTQGGNIMNVDVVGYNVDYDKINDQITIQNYKPSSEDFSLIVSSIIPLFVPGLCIILLLYFIFKFIKKIF